MLTPAPGNYLQTEKAREQDQLAELEDDDSEVSLIPC